MIFILCLMKTFWESDTLLDFQVYLSQVSKNKLKIVNSHGVMEIGNSSGFRSIHVLTGTQDLNETYGSMVIFDENQFFF